jgi:hypothetical protein
MRVKLQTATYQVDVDVAEIMREGLSYKIEYTVHYEFLPNVACSAVGLAKFRN